MKLKLKLRKEDKRSLIILGIFLSLVGYYYWIFNPIYRRWQKTSFKVEELNKKLKEEEAKLGLKKRIRRRHKELLKELGILKAKINKSFIKGNLGEKVGTITMLAQQCGIKLSNLRPVVRKDPETGETYYEFILEGEATPFQFIDFVEDLWGLNLKELNISKTRKGTFHFYIKAVSLPQEIAEVFKKVKAVPTKKKKLVVFKIPKPQIIPAKVEKVETNKKPPSIKPPPPKLNLTGLRLVGISSLGNEKMAVIVDDTKHEDYFVKTGDYVRKYRVVKIEENKVVLSNDQGVTGEITFPKEKSSPGETQSQEVASTQKPKKKKRIHLGISLRVITSELAKERKLPVSTGLLVTKSKDGSPILPGDVITQINGLPVSTIMQAKKIIANIQPGQEINFKVWREGEWQNIKVTP
ncbi:MAG: PDZ domain-containing protein [Thermodesulfobacteria bacterium]|nr:PDZ domain-containing protein [Thermodesulfobacteriota bacterium]